MKTENRQKVLLIGAIVLVGLWAGDRLVVSPLIDAWKRRSERIAELRSSPYGRPTGASTSASPPL